MSISITKRMEHVYDVIAPQYAQTHRNPSNHLILAAEKFLELGNKSQTILDLGCGTGRDMSWFETKGRTVVGVDISRGMLREAKKKVFGALIQMNMLTLGFRDRSFHNIWCNASILHIPKESVRLALSEIHRVLHEDGLLLLSLQEGFGQGWEVSRIGNIDRWMSRYSSDEIKDHLLNSGFDVEYNIIHGDKPHAWLRFYARRK